MRVLAYGRHFLLLSFAALILPLGWLALDTLPAGDPRFWTSFALVGVLHASSIVVAVRGGTTAKRAIAFVGFAAALSAVTPFVALLAAPVLELAVPAVLRVIPSLRSIGDSTPGDSIRFLLVVLFASAFGSSGYWLLIRTFWLKSLRLGDWLRTVGLCLTATFLAFLVPAVLSSINRDIAGPLPSVLWWFAFSVSLYWSEDTEKSSAGEPGMAIEHL